MSEDQLNVTADRIERVLSAHRMPFRIDCIDLHSNGAILNLPTRSRAHTNAITKLRDEMRLATGYMELEIVLHNETICIRLPDAQPGFIPQSREDNSQ
jgi:hypothetical protein